MIKDDVMHGGVHLPELVERLKMAVVNRGADYESALVGIKDVNRPGLQLAGYFDYFDERRLQVIGMAETKMLESMTSEQRSESFAKLFSYNIPALVVSRDLDIYPECLTMARKYQRTLLHTAETTVDFTTKVIELLTSFEPAFKMMGGWWQQLFGESEGKDGKGLFPVTAEFTADLHSLGQMIQQGQRNLFETMVRFAPPARTVTVGSDWKNLDGLNYLEGKTLDFVDEQAFRGTVAAHVDGGVPVITMDMGELDDMKLGELFYFFELSCGISAYMLGVNPFNQPGVEFYKRNMFQLLGKPGYEKK